MTIAEILPECFVDTNVVNTLLSTKNSASHYIVRVSPAMETFLLDIAAAESVSLADFGLPAELKDLSKLTKDAKAKDDNRIKRLIRRLSSNPEMAAMKTILTYLNEKRYGADMDELKTKLKIN